MNIDETLARARSHLSRLDPAEASAATREKDSFIVDIRPAAQRRQSGEIAGAIVIERNHLEWRLDPTSDARIPEAVNSAIRWIVICEAGYSSSLAADSLHQIGLWRSTDVVGGFQAWSEAHLPVRWPDSPARPRNPGEGAGFPEWADARLPVGRPSVELAVDRSGAEDAAADHLRRPGT
jgi:rhodanese-related sulfurtransferase